MNRRSIAGIAGFMLALLPLAAPAAPERATLVTLPGGTPISIHLTSELSSGNAREGDQFSFSVNDDVRANGWLVIPAGAQGIGEVVGVEHAGGSGRGGKLELQFDYVYAVDGKKVRVTRVASSAVGEARTGAASTATIASWALLGLPGLFAHNWVKGRDATVTPKVTFPIFVESTVHIEALEHSGVADDFAH